MRLGSLFSGAAGLDRAVEEVFGATTAWHSEVDPAASKVLAHRFPDVPNHGDITKIDWSSVEPVDILCGGFPCQDVSAAGRRAGIKDGTRSGLWSVYADAIAALRPRWVVIENVRGLLSAAAHRAVESADTVVGDGSGGPVLRAAGAVLGDLADIGYDARWQTVAASDVGAPHRRERVFIVASDTRHGVEPERTWPTGWVSGQRAPVRAVVGRGGEDVVADTQGQRWTPRYQSRENVVQDGPKSAHADPHGGVAVGVGLLPTPSASDGAGGKTSRSGDCIDELLLGGIAQAYSNGVFIQDDLLPTPVARDFKGHGPSDMDRHSPNLSAISSYLLPTPGAMDWVHPKNPENMQKQQDRGYGSDLRDVAPLLPTPCASDNSGGGVHPDRRAGHSNQLIDYVKLEPERWGKYAPAISRWEQVTRPAPSPTEPNKNGNPRLSAAFSEWLMGWPEGWVTKAPGISRNDQLRIVGNGVCSQQATAALSWLLSLELAGVGW